MRGLLDQMVSMVYLPFMSNKSISVRRDRGLRAAIEAADGVNNLARGIGVRSQAISQWERVPATRVRAVSNFTGIPDYVIRPDLYTRMAWVERADTDLVHG